MSAEHDKQPEHEPKTVTVYFNGRAREIPKKDTITFEEAVAYAFENPPSGDGVQFSVQYSRGHGHGLELRPAGPGPGPGLASRG